MTEESVMAPRCFARQIRRMDVPSIKRGRQWEDKQVGESVWDMLTWRCHLDTRENTD